MENDIDLDIGEEKDILFYYTPPTDFICHPYPWNIVFGIGWKRISCGDVYFEYTEISLDNSNEVLCKAIELAIRRTCYGHKSFFMSLLRKDNPYDPMEKTTLSRDEYYSNLLKNVTSEKYFRKADELKKYVYEQHNLTGDKDENTCRTY